MFSGLNIFIYKVLIPVERVLKRVPTYFSFIGVRYDYTVVLYCLIYSYMINEAAMLTLIL